MALHLLCALLVAPVLTRELASDPAAYTRPAYHYPGIYEHDKAHGTMYSANKLHADADQYAATHVKHHGSTEEEDETQVIYMANAKLVSEDGAVLHHHGVDKASLVSAKMLTVHGDEPYILIRKGRDQHAHVATNLELTAEEEASIYTALDKTTKVDSYGSGGAVDLHYAMKGAHEVGAKHYTVVKAVDDKVVAVNVPAYHGHVVGYDHDEVYAAHHVHRSAHGDYTKAVGKQEVDAHTEGGATVKDYSLIGSHSEHHDHKVVGPIHHHGHGHGHGPY